jgi:hypothetical protein
LNFLRALCGFSFANLVVKGSFSRRTSKDFNRKGREEKAAKDAKKFEALPSARSSQASGFG